MPKVADIYSLPRELVLGKRLNDRVPAADQSRQRNEVVEVLKRLRRQPGVILADEVGMGKTFVALAVAYSVAIRSRCGPAIVMVPPNLVEKWEQDLKTFCELYLEGRYPATRRGTSKRALTDPSAIRYGVARDGVELMKFLDDSSRERCHLVFLAQGAMARRQKDIWVRLALIAEALHRHARGRAARLIKVKRHIHRFLAELLWAVGVQRATDLGKDVWQSVLRTPSSAWREIYNSAVRNEQAQLDDDPVPKAVTRALGRLDLRPLATALEQMPVRARGGTGRVSERLNVARKALRQVEEQLWKELLAQARWRSPLLVMDEAHHLKNPSTLLARQFQTRNEQELRTGDGAMAQAFDRMLFLTATPFQLGHHELVRVLERFGDVRWDVKVLGNLGDFRQKLDELENSLTESQRAAIRLQQSWVRLQPDDLNGDLDLWWDQLYRAETSALTYRQRAAVEAFRAAEHSRNVAEKALRPWIVRHNKAACWPESEIPRRTRLSGVAVAGHEAPTGLPIPPQQLLPFFLAARSAVNAHKDLLGDALCSSYEAFRFTRQNRRADKDEQEHVADASVDISHSGWYLQEFDSALEGSSGSGHPKVNATVHKVVDLWEHGEKVLVFAFYRQTCRALRIHISHEIEVRLMSAAERRLREAGMCENRTDVERFLERIQRRYLDDKDSPGRRAVDAALGEILAKHAKALEVAGMTREWREVLVDIMRRFLRVTTTLARCFPLVDLDSIKPVDAIAQTLDHADESGVSWRNKFHGFMCFLASQCSTEERRLYIEAVQRTQTGSIRVEDVEDEDAETRRMTLANVQVAMGETKRDKRARLMRAFNTPFFPDILVCSEVMGEGVDLQRFCRHVIHHDLAWNPSTIEQRTGRVDRIGCKAEGRHPIFVYLPYLAGTADERQYQVMSDREQWFRVVMGQDEVARLITPDSDNTVPLPEAVSERLNFKLGLEPARTLDI